MTTAISRLKDGEIKNIRNEVEEGRKFVYNGI